MINFGNAGHYICTCGSITGIGEKGQTTVSVVWAAFLLGQTLDQALQKSNWPFHSCTSFHVDVCFYFSYVYTLELKLLGHVVTLCLNFWETARLFSKVTALFHIFTSSQWSLQFLCILVTTVFLLIAILVSIMCLICISLMTFSCVYWVSVYLIWRNSYLIALTI